MTQRTPLVEFSKRILGAIDDIVPDAAKAQLRPIVDDAIASLDLVPRAELDAHLRLLKQLEARMTALEDKLREASETGE